MSLNFNTLKQAFIPNSWERARTTDELKSFIDTLHERVADVDLGL